MKRVVTKIRRKPDRDSDITHHFVGVNERRDVHRIVYHRPELYEAMVQSLSEIRVVHTVS